MSDSQHACSDSNGGPSDSKSEGADAPEAADGTAGPERTEANHEGLADLLQRSTPVRFSALTRGYVRAVRERNAALDRVAELEAERERLWWALWDRQCDDANKEGYLEADGCEEASRRMAKLGFPEEGRP